MKSVDYFAIILHRDRMTDRQKDDRQTALIVQCPRV